MTLHQYYIDKRLPCVMIFFLGFQIGTGESLFYFQFSPHVCNIFPMLDFSLKRWVYPCSIFCPCSISLPLFYFISFWSILFRSGKKNGISPSSSGFNGTFYAMYDFPYPVVYNNSNFPSLQE